MSYHGVGKIIFMFFTFSDYPYPWKNSYRREMDILPLLFKPNQSPENNSSRKNKNVIIAFKSLIFNFTHSKNDGVGNVENNALFHRFMTRNN